jgi:hypothetical protein
MAPLCVSPFRSGVACGYMRGGWGEALVFFFISISMITKVNSENVHGIQTLPITGGDRQIDAREGAVRVDSGRKRKFDSEAFHVSLLKFNNVFGKCVLPSQTSQKRGETSSR